MYLFHWLLCNFKYRWSKFLKFIFYKVWVDLSIERSMSLENVELGVAASLTH